MITERIGPKPKEKREVDVTTSGFFLPGAFAKREGMAGVQGVLDDRFGTAIAYDSGLLGSKPDKLRYDRMADEFEASIRRGNTTIVAHSFGSAELYEIFKRLGADFIAEHKDRIHLKLISPVMPENAREGAAYAGKFVRLGVQELGMLGHTIPTETGLLQGIASINTMPPNQSLHEDLPEYMREQWPDLSHAGEEAHVLERTSYRDYISLFTREDAQKVERIDEKIQRARVKNKKRRVGRNVRKRGRVTSVLDRQITDGKLAHHFGEEQMQNTDYKGSLKAKTTQAKLLRDAFIKGHVYTMLDQLADLGVDMHLVVPEYDSMGSRKEAEAFKGDRDNVRVSVGEFATHNAPLVAQKNYLESILDAA